MSGGTLRVARKPFSQFPYPCSVQLCDPPRPTEHGLYKCSEPSLRKADSNAQLGNGTVCTLTCSDGYDVKGVADVKCMESGKWNNTNIHCWKGMVLFTCAFYINL